MNVTREQRARNIPRAHAIVTRPFPIRFHIFLAIVFALASSSNIAFMVPSLLSAFVASELTPRERRGDR